MANSQDKSIKAVANSQDELIYSFTVALTTACPFCLDHREAMSHPPSSGNNHSHLHPFPKTDISPRLTWPPTDQLSSPAPPPALPLCSCLVGCAHPPLFFFARPLTLLGSSPLLHTPLFSPMRVPHWLYLDLTVKFSYVGSIWILW